MFRVTVQGLQGLPQGSKYTSTTKNIGDSNGKEHGKKIENEMATGVLKRDPGIRMIPTLGPKVCKGYLHWAFLIPRVSVLV